MNHHYGQLTRDGPPPATTSNSTKWPSTNFNRLVTLRGGVLDSADLPDDRPRPPLDIEPEPQHQPFLLGLVPILKFRAGVHHRVIVEEARLAG